MLASLRVILLLLSSAVLAAAQGCPGQGDATLRFSAPVLGGTLDVDLGAAPGAPYLWLIDAQPGSFSFPGFGPVCLGLTPALAAIVDGIAGGGAPMPATGMLSLGLAMPADPLLAGLITYSQLFAIDPAAPNGWAISEPASVRFTLPDAHLPTLNQMTTWRGLHASAPFEGGRYVLVTGGGGGTLIGPTPMANVDVYDNYTRTYVPGPNLAVPRVLHTCTRLQDGRFLIAGGLDGTAIFNHSDAEIYDPATGQLTPTGNSMSLPRAAHTATLLDDGRVLLAGGNTIFTTGGTGSNFLQIFTSALSQTDIYDPVSNTFSPGPVMSAARFGGSAIKLPDGRVLLAGGINGGFQIPFTQVGVPTYTASADLFDPTADTITPTGSTNATRALGMMALLPSGNVLLVGGVASTLVTSSATAEIYSPSLGAWTGSAPLPQAAALASIATLADGSIVVVGGGQGSLAMFGPIANVARYVEGAGWNALANLPVASMNHTMDRLADGSWLISGGVDPTGIAIITGQVWTP